MSNPDVMSQVEKSMANMQAMAGELNEQVQSNWAKLATVCLRKDDTTQAMAAASSKLSTAKKRTKKIAKQAESSASVAAELSSEPEDLEVQAEPVSVLELEIAPQQADISPTIPAAS